MVLREAWLDAGKALRHREKAFTRERDALACGPAICNHRETAMRGSEAPGLSVFHRDEAGRLFHTYSCYSRGLDPMNTAYQLLDIVPKGRDERGLPFPMSRVRRRDEY